MDLDRYIASHPESHRRIFAIELGGKPAWVKRGRKHYRHALYREISQAHRYLRNMVHEVSARADQKHLEHEIHCTRALQKRGMLTPEILRAGPGYLLLSHVGLSLRQRMMQAHPLDRPAIVREAAQTLARLHRCGGWHGAASLDNLTQHIYGIGLIDYDTSSRHFLPLCARQSRDLWQLGHSVVPFDADGSLIAAMLESYGRTAALPLLRVAGIIVFPFCTLLRPWRHSLGRDWARSFSMLDALMRHAMPWKMPARFSLAPHRVKA